jgi:exosortase A
VAETVGPERGVRGALIAFGVIAAGCVVAFLPSWSILAERWLHWSFGYDHGWLIAGVAAWLVWRERSLLAAGRHWWPGLAIVLLAGLGWLAARSIDVVIGQEIMLPVLLWGAALTVFGGRAARALLFPLGFLYFAIPVWDYLNPLLQSATTTMVGAWIGASGVPALIEGNLVTIPAGQFIIASGCAGQSFFVTAGALAALYGHLHYRHIGRSLLLMAVALAGAIVVNWLRVYIVIMAGHLTDMQHYLVRVDHYTFGWALFAIGLVPFYFLARRLEQPAAAEPCAAPAEFRPQNPAVVIATVAALAAAPLLWVIADGAAAHGALDASPVMPEAPGWMRGEAGADWRPDYHGADAELGARYASDAGRVDVWIVYYGSQAQGRELVWFANRIAAPKSWRVERSRRLEAAPAMNEALIVDEAGNQRLVRWWYEVGGRPAVSTVGAKLLQAVARFSGRREAALVALSVRCDPDCKAATSTLDDFAAAMSRSLRQAVNGGTSDQAG